MVTGRYGVPLLGLAKSIYYKANKSYRKLSSILLESSTTSVTTLFRFQEVSFRSQAGVQKVMDTRSN